MGNLRANRPRPWHRLALVLVLLVVAGAAGGCFLLFPDRSQAASEIGETIEAMPGVARVAWRHDVSFDGGAHFEISARLDQGVTADQTAAIAERFIEKTLAADFSRFNSVELSLLHRRDADAETVDGNYTFDTLSGDWHHDSAFSATYESISQGPSINDNLRASRETVDPAARLWTDAAHTPGIRISTSLPPDRMDYQSFTIGVAVDVGADDTILNELIDHHPELNTARWHIEIPGWPSRSWSRPRDYYITGEMPESSLRLAWKTVADAIGKDDNASATTELPPPDPDTATTTVKIEVAWSENGPADYFEQAADRVAPLLKEFPGPVLLELNTKPPKRTGAPPRRKIGVTLGGCTTTPATDPLEHQLRQTFELC